MSQTRTASPATSPLLLAPTIRRNAVDLAIDFDAFVTRRELRPAYQPIVDLGSGAVVGFEALARWPDLAGASPDRVFAAARYNGRLADLDWACRLAAFEGALDHGLSRDLALFINVEPDTLGTPVPPGGAAALAAAHDNLRVMVELTERSLCRRPAELLRFVDWARERGWGIALDDVGAEPESLALLPFVAPDVVKLDMSLIRERANLDRAAIMAAVMAHSERTGAVILAEGIETGAHLDQAHALGATLGQGWMFGRPGPLVHAVPTTSPLLAALPTSLVAPTPFSLIDHPGQLRVGRKGLLLSLSRHIESQALHLRPAPIVLGAFQTAERFTPATAARYAALANNCPLVAAVGHGLHGDAAPGVRCAALSLSDPLVGEWTVTVIGSHYAGALIARDLGDSGPDHDRRFEFVVTHDRELVLGAARSLMSRITKA